MRWPTDDAICLIILLLAVPVRLIKEKCSQAEAATMKLIAWWDWTDERIKECVVDFHLSIPEFIAKHQ
jgi:hypothetical protein